VQRVEHYRLREAGGQWNQVIRAASHYCKVRVLRRLLIIDVIIVATAKLFFHSRNSGNENAISRELPTLFNKT
jgi:hypothetical protein